MLDLQCTSVVKLLLLSGCEAASQSAPLVPVQAAHVGQPAATSALPTVTLLPHLQGPLTEGRRHWARKALQLVRARLAAETMMQLKSQPVLAEERLELGSLVIVSLMLGGTPL